MGRASGERAAGRAGAEQEEGAGRTPLPPVAGVEEIV